MLEKFLKLNNWNYEPDIDTCLKVRAYSIEEGRQDFIDQLLAFTELIGIDDLTADVISIENQICGCRLDIETIDDIPHESIYCKHGNGMFVYEIITRNFNEFKKEIIWDSNFKVDLT